MSLLINSEIQEHLGDSIIISPFNKDQLNTNSYDLCVGPWIARYKVQHDGRVLQLDRDLAEFELQDVRNGRQWKTGYIRLAPGERVLAHSLEFAGGQIARTSSWPHAVTTSLRATSTAGRLGIQVCGCAGLGDVGFINRWTFELQSLNPNVIMIPVGAVIAQLEFHLVEKPPEETLYGKPSKGNYQNGNDLRALMADWRPEQMLPKRLKVKEWAREYAEDLTREGEAICTQEGSVGTGPISRR